MSIEEIVSKIKNAPTTHNPVLIAVEGYGGSGKTTFANRLAEKLGDTYIVSIDDFIVKEKLLEPSWDKGSFDRERVEKQVLKPLSEGKTARYQKLIWTDNLLSEYVEVP